MHIQLFIVVVCLSVARNTCVQRCFLVDNSSMCSANNIQVGRKKVVVCMVCRQVFLIEQFEVSHLILMAINWHKSLLNSLATDLF